MLANALRPVGRAHCCTPSRVETAAGRASAPPKSPYVATFAQRCLSTGRARESNVARRDDLLMEIIMYGPKTTPRLGEARGAGNYDEDGILRRHYAASSSIRSPDWWGGQPCVCRGAGACPTCRRFHRAITRIERHREVAL